MMCQIYKALLKRFLTCSHGYTFTRRSLRALVYRHCGSRKDSIQKCHGGRSVHRMCTVCMTNHSEAGSQTEEKSVQIKTYSKDADLPEDDYEKGGDEADKNERFKENENLHIPVLKDTVLSYLGGKSGQKLLDMTFGAGGHTKALLDSAPGSHVFAMDRDPCAHKIALELAEERPGQVTPLLGRFSELPSLLSDRGVKVDSIDGVLFDFGCSSMQFDRSERGFSLSMDGPLDMRMDADRSPGQPTAADVVNTLDEVDLAKIFKKYGEDRRAMKLAHAMIDARSAFGRITRTKELADIVEGVCGGAIGHDSLGRYSHPATRIFQALRIFVNNELNEISSGIDIAHEYLRPGGMCVAISFHSLEDRIVKRHFHTVDLDENNSLSIVQRHRIMSHASGYTKDQLDEMIVRKWAPIRKKVTVATEAEKEVNPRSRSAKLRAARKLSTSH